MRGTFIQTISRLAREDPKVMLVIGDTGFSVMEPFEAEFGARFVNVGIAEQSFVSFAAGLAAAGMKPFAYNVVSFMTLRSAEQIMLDVCYQENPVILVGVGGGFAYGTAGPTHHALQDIAMMRAFPNIDVYCPADPAEMEAVMLTAYRRQRPAYIRIGRSVDAPIHQGPVAEPVEKAIPLAHGTDLAILACGTILREAVQVQKLLEERGCSVTLYSVPGYSRWTRRQFWPVPPGTGRCSPWRSTGSPAGWAAPWRSCSWSAGNIRRCSTGTACPTPSPCSPAPGTTSWITSTCPPKRRRRTCGSGGVTENEWRNWRNLCPV